MSKYCNVWSRRKKILVDQSCNLFSFILIEPSTIHKTISSIIYLYYVYMYTKSHIYFKDISYDFIKIIIKAFMSICISYTINFTVQQLD